MMNAFSETLKSRSANILLSLALAAITHITIRHETQSAELIITASLKSGLIVTVAFAIYRLP
ncbi:MAG TPA: hypothetical protein VGN42_15065 [Pirellulales bacterium]|jgi:uncharacterized membrane protein YkvI|nr:hypothetical protein [Pirellulales bacterium]